MTGEATTVRLYRVAEAAEVLGVNPDTLRAWADSGRVKSGRTPAGQRVFDPRELDRVRAQMLGQEVGSE